jgi:hypothetical protein
LEGFIPPISIRRAGFAGSRSDFCEGELARREQRIASLQFFRPEMPAGISEKTENLLHNREIPGVVLT